MLGSKRGISALRNRSEPWSRWLPWVYMLVSEDTPSCFTGISKSHKASSSQMEAHHKVSLYILSGFSRWGVACELRKDLAGAPSPITKLPRLGLPRIALILESNAYRPRRSTSNHCTSRLASSWRCWYRLASSVMTRFSHTS